jgi:hypothetical protein
VGGGDRRHDRQPEAQAVVPAGPGTGPARVARLTAALEGEQQAADRVGRDLFPGVGDGEERAAVVGAGGDPDGAARLVVPQGVVGQVAHGALEQRLVAAEQSGCERDLHGQAACRDLLAPPGEHVAGDRRQVERHPAGEAALAAGQDEQRLDQPFLLGAGGERALAGGAQRPGRGVGVPQRDLEQRL